MKRLPFLLLFVTSISHAQGITVLLPDSIGEYAKSDSARIYTGDELYDLIDGGADIFREYGFDRVMVQRYSDARDSYIDVELYEMRDSSSAYGIFSMITFNTGQRIAGFPGEAYGGDGFLLLWKGKYYASLTASGRSDDSEMVRAAVEITRRIPESGRPPLVSICERMLSTGSGDLRVACIKGGLGLYNLSKISFGGDLDFREGVCLFTNSVESIVLAYDSDDSCGADYSVNVNHMKSSTDWNPVESGPDSSVFEKQEEHLVFRRFGIYLLILKSGNRPAAEEMCERIRAALKRD